MKLLSTILLSALLLLSVSCNRKVIAASSHTTLHQDSSSTAIDTTNSSFTETNIETVAFGDTLTTKIIVPTSPQPSPKGEGGKPKPFPIFVESNGIIILGSITAKEDGSSFDLDLKAIAKPKSVTSINTKTGTENKGISTLTNTNKDLKEITKNKTIEAVSEVPKWIGLTLMFLGILLLLAVVIYLYFKNKSNG